MAAINEKLVHALDDLITNICEDVPIGSMTRHLIDSINTASELLGRPAPLTEDEDDA